MKWPGWMLLVAVPVLALATPPPGPHQGPMGPEHERRARIFRVVALAEQLELEPAQALKLDEQLRHFDERRRTLVMQVMEARRTLGRAAMGDESAVKEVDAATQRALDAREKMAALDREALAALSRDLSPVKRARLALFLGRELERGRARFHGRERENDKHHPPFHALRSAMGPDDGEDEGMPGELADDDG